MKLYITLIFFFLSLSLSAQTLLGPTFGYDFATLETQRIFREGTVVDGYWQDRMLIERNEKDNGSGRRSIVLGFQVQKILSSQWSLAFRANYSKKSYVETVDNFLATFAPQVYELSYRQIGLSVLINRKIKDKLSIGIGPNLTHFTEWQMRWLENIPLSINKRAYGLNLQLGYYLGPIYFAVDYMRTLKISDVSDYMTGASSLAVTGTYFFELKKRK